MYVFINDTKYRMAANELRKKDTLYAPVILVNINAGMLEEAENVNRDTGQISQCIYLRVMSQS